MAPTLFKLSLEVVCNHFPAFEKDLSSTPVITLCDVLYTMAKRKRTPEVKKHLKSLNLFCKVLLVPQKRSQLHWIFQAINQHDFEYEPAEIISSIKDTPISSNQLLAACLARSYTEDCTRRMHEPNQREHLFNTGILLGEFLYDAGWFYEASNVLRQCLFVSLSSNDILSLKKTLSCLEKLLIAQVDFSMHKESRQTYETSQIVIKKLKSSETNVNCARIYSTFVNYNLMECRYDEALKWSLESLREMDTGMDVRTIIDVLRRGAKSCLMKREFTKAELLITEAVYLAKDFYGSSSVKYADALLDYGYFLINRDSAHQSVTVYNEVLEIRKKAFGHYSLMTAIAYEDLAYAIYVMEYTSGNFTYAKQYADEAISIMTILLPKDNLQLASAKRVKALILEEMAIDSAGTPLQNQLLNEAEKLHLCALKLSTDAFGELNVQPAKHYGNLGRLYQTMKKYQDSEHMHLKAIAIKEKLLGVYDYEVALSLGHLASLYNYDMHRYKKAEELHLRSIKIGMKLFGEGYSGLEYDYRGLLEVYRMEGNLAKVAEYERILSQWRMLQDIRLVTPKEVPICSSNKSRPINQVIDDFFNLDWSRSSDQLS